MRQMGPLRLRCQAYLKSTLVFKFGACSLNSERETRSILIHFIAFKVQANRDGGEELTC